MKGKKADSCQDNQKNQHQGGQFFSHTSIIMGTIRGLRLMV
jgi:hypothetical protein